MKKLFILIVAVIGIFGCKKDTPDFPDYKYTSVYFPLQTPMRTLILGEYAQADNSLDNKLQFNMGVAIGGRRENYQDEWVKFEIKESLVDGFAFSNGDVLQVLPKKYYTTSPANGEKIIIPKGSMEGKVLVSLTQEFLTDPDAWKNKYVIPVLITEKSAGIDTILQGNPASANPNLLVATNWTLAPKNYTVFGIKFVNEYHGNYLHFGMDYTLDAAGNRLTTPAPVKYSTYFVEQNAVWKLATSGRNILESNGVANSTSSKMRLTINTDNTVAISPVSGTKVVDNTKSTGKFVKKGGKWGGTNYDALFLDYKYWEDYVSQKTIVDDQDASIIYTGTWNSNGEVGTYGGNRHYSNIQGDYFLFSFVGTETALYFKVGDYGTIDVYLDDMNTPIAKDISTYSASVAYQVKLFEKKGLAPGKHTLKCAVKSVGKNVIFDYCDYLSNDALPSGKYLHEVKDTLVFRDKGIVFETFKVK